jgi:hypothetical protein
MRLALHPANVPIAGGKNVVAGGFCPTITENELKIIPYFTRRIKWTGWELNPRPPLANQLLFIEPKMVVF